MPKPRTVYQTKNATFFPTILSVVDRTQQQLSQPQKTSILDQLSIQRFSRTHLALVIARQLTAPPNLLAIYRANAATAMMPRFIQLNLNTTPTHSQPKFTNSQKSATLRSASGVGQFWPVDDSKHLRQSWLSEQCLPSTPKLTTFLSYCSIYVLKSTSRPLASIRGSQHLSFFCFSIRRNLWPVAP